MAIVLFLIIINQCSIISCNKVQKLKSISKTLPGSRWHQINECCQTRQGMNNFPVVHLFPPPNLLVEELMCTQQTGWAPCHILAILGSCQWKPGCVALSKGGLEIEIKEPNMGHWGWTGQGLTSHIDEELLKAWTEKRWPTSLLCLLLLPWPLFSLLLLFIGEVRVSGTSSEIAAQSRCWDWETDH